MLKTFLTSFAIFYYWGGLFMHILLHGKKIERMFFGPFAHQLSSRR